MVEQAGKGQDLALADELLIEVGVEKLNLFAHRASDLGLLHAFGIGQLFLAKPQHLAVIQAEGEGADQQHGAQDQQAGGGGDTCEPVCRAWVA